MDTYRFLNVRFDVRTPAAALAAVMERGQALQAFSYVVTPNAQGIVRRNTESNPVTEAAFEDAWLSLNDSGPAQLLAKRLLGLELGRVTGSDLTVALLEQIRPETEITLLGGDDELERRLRLVYGLRKINRYNPPMGLLHNPAEIERSARFIIDNPAPYTFIVVGSPQAEVVAHRVQQLGGGKGVGLCVGSALNFAVGLTPRAPAWMARYSLEWLHRLAINPRGHAKRVFVQSFPLVWLAVSAAAHAGASGAPAI